MCKHNPHIEVPTITYPSANNLEILAQQVWKEKDMDIKKRKVFEMIEHFKFKQKYQFYKDTCEKLSRIGEIDKFAANLMLVDNMRVIK